MKFFINGRFVQEKDARISVNDLGIIRGYGVFDFLRTYNKTPFLLKEHLNRFFYSAKKANIKVPFNRKEIREIIAKLIKKNSKLAEEFTFRIVLTGGKPQGSRLSINPNFFILCQKPHIYDKELYLKGAALRVLNYCRQFPEIKSLNYFFAVSQWEKIEKARAVEALYVYKNKIYECSSSNFFIVKKNRIYTPKEEILGGVTRNLVVRLIKSKLRKFSVIEKSLFFKEALTADEAFITSTEKEIMPIVSIDGIKIGRGVPGGVVKEIIKEFNKYTASYGREKKKNGG